MGGGWAWVRLGKIKCAAKALARVAACSSFNFAKGWHFVCHFSVYLMMLVSVFLHPTYNTKPSFNGNFCALNDFFNPHKLNLFYLLLKRQILLIVLKMKSIKTLYVLYFNTLKY
jgi:hypothetical protein